MLPAIAPHPPRRFPAVPVLLALAVFVLAAALRVANFNVTDRSPDEVLYAKFGDSIAREGPAWVTRTTRAFNRDEDVEYPWQQRIGFTSLIGLAMRVSGDHTPRAGAAVSTLCSLALVALVGVVGFECLSPWIAIVAMLFLAVSPLDLALARRAWQDDVMALLTFLMLWAVLRHLTRGGARPALAFFALSTFALLVKESAVIPFGLGTLALAIEAWRCSRHWRAPALVLGMGALATLLALAAVIAVAGGWTELRHTLEIGREALAPDDYMRQYQSGGPGYYLVGMRILQPLPFLLGGLGMLLALVRPAWLASGASRPRAAEVLRVLGALVAVFAGVSFAYFSKNLRFLSPIYAPVALLAAALLMAGLARVRARGPRRLAWAATALVVLALGASAVRDVACFDHYFNRWGVQDLATPWFTQVDAREHAGR